MFWSIYYIVCVCVCVCVYIYMYERAVLLIFCIYIIEKKCQKKKIIYFSKITFLFQELNGIDKIIQIEHYKVKLSD